MQLRLLTPIALVLSAAMVLWAADDRAKKTYLALGDSVSFGFIAQAGFEYVNPANFIGFPNYVGAALKLALSNGACPGETSTSFLSSTAPDNGCRLFRAAAPLHVPYASTQIEFAMAFLKAHPDTRLVTIALGADDVLLLQAACLGDQACIASGLSPVLANVARNLEEIIAKVRTAGFQRTIVLVNYYSVDYADLIQTTTTSALNEAIAAAADRGAVVADVFTAFRNAAELSGGHTCNAGLLNASPQNQFLCDIHPSQSGHALIARTIEKAVESAEANDR